jgi:beta-lactamase class D
MKNLLLSFFIVLSLNSSGQKVNSVDLKSLFGEYTGGLCVFDLNKNEFTLYNPEHCKTRFSPCSTFKIPNSLIGLESGVIPDTGFVIPYDPVLHPRDSVMALNEPFRY